MKHSHLCPDLTTPSSFMGVRLNLDAKATAALDLGVSMVKGLLGACLTGRLDGFGQTLDTAADIAHQATAHPNVYHRPKP